MEVGGPFIIDCLAPPFILFLFMIIENFHPENLEEIKGKFKFDCWVFPERKRFHFTL